MIRAENSKCSSSRAMLQPPRLSATSPVHGLLQSPYQTHWSWHYHTQAFLSQSPQRVSIWDSHPSKPLFSQRPFMSCIHRSLESSFPSEQVTHGYLQASPRRVTIWVKDTHTPDVRPVAGTLSRQIHLWRYPHVHEYKMINRRPLNYAYSCEVI